MAPDIPLRDVIYGVLPFVALMALAIVLICLVPGNRDVVPQCADGAARALNAARWSRSRCEARQPTRKMAGTRV